MKAKKIYEGDVKDGAKADCTITVDDDDFVLLAQGKQNAQQVFIFLLSRKKIHIYIIKTSNLDVHER